MNLLRVALLSALILGIAAAISFLPAFLPMTPETYVAQRVGDSRGLFSSLMQDLSTTASEEGIPYAVDVVATALRSGDLTNDECHTLLHLLGHDAFTAYGTDLEALLSANRGRLCLGGYFHGVEAEIASRSERPREDLFALCSQMKEVGVANGPCYHGVGHSAFELTKDIEKSLAYCDSLQGGPEPELWNCYRGVFSELGNALLGIDSSTGIAVEPFSSPQISRESAYSYCASTSKKYQEACYTQLAKIFIDSFSLESGLMRCLREAKDELGQGYCVNTIAGVWARTTLDASDYIPELNVLLTFPPQLQESALKGMAEGFYAHREAGKTLTAEGVCTEAKESQLRERCEVALGR